ncbi:WHG domain-containing protein [Actinomycetaceae bacterium L2_0104]
MPRANLNESAVVSAALSIADLEGLDAVTVSSVARKLGVKPASLYSHVRDRAGLFSAMHRRALGELSGRVSADIAGRAGKDALVALADAHRTLAHDRPGMWALLQRPAPAEVVRSSEAERIASLILAVLRGYSLPDGELVNGVRFVGATINGYLALMHTEAFSNRSESHDASWEATIAAIDRALRSWPREGTSL